MDSPFISVTEAAARLGIHYSTLYRLIQADESPVPPVKFGRRKVFRACDVDAFVTGNMSKAG